MNGFNFNFNNPFFGSTFETPEQRKFKKDELKKRFSRIFLALFIYTLISQFLSTVLYVVAALVLPREQYDAIYESKLATVIISCAVQYLIAFPVLFLIIRDVDKAKPREERKLTTKEFIPLLFIAQFLMIVGNIIGNFINSVIGNLFGQVPENSISGIIAEIPIPVIIVLVVVIGPIVEELIFRKLLIDRLSIYGDHIAILYSAIAFGLIHGNLYQFFYATMLGVLLGYVYTSTGKVKYTMLMHMIINFLGSIVPLSIADHLESLSLVLENAQIYDLEMLLAYLPSLVVYLLYSSFETSLTVGGAVALVFYVKKKKLRVSREKEVNLTDIEIIKNGTANTGVILFLIVSFIISLISLTLQ